MNIWPAPHGFYVTLAQVDHAKAMSKIHQEGFFRPWPVGDFISYITDAQTTPCFIVTNAKGLLVGFATLRKSFGECEILTIAVAKSKRGKGLGRALLKACLEDLSQTATKTVFLEVDETNKPAVALYKSLGFKQIAIRKGYYPHADGSQTAALVMQLDLG